MLIYHTRRPVERVDVAYIPVPPPYEIRAAYIQRRLVGAMAEEAGISDSEWISGMYTHNQLYPQC
jgi:hypothetical protein